MEIERKFLVADLPGGLGEARVTEIDQGYLVIGDGGSETRVRRRSGAYTLTVKAGVGAVRQEAEIRLTEEQFAALWPLTAGRRVEKARHELALDGGLVAELDVYGGELEGLRVVEVEFPDAAAAAAFAPPGWFGADVTADDAYKNRRLAVDGRPGG